MILLETLFTRTPGFTVRSPYDGAMWFILPTNQVWKIKHKFTPYTHLFYIRFTHPLCKSIQTNTNMCNHYACEKFTFFKWLQTNDPLRKIFARHRFNDLWLTKNNVGQLENKTWKKNDCRGEHNV